jgi:site-specific DNA-methyltransferase (adenine-specific)
MIVEQMLKNAPNPLLHIADVSGSALFQGDCLEIMPLIPDKSVQLILADLPYGTTACKWDSIIDLDLLWKQYKRIIKDNGAIVLTASQPFTTKLISSNYEMFKYCWVWNKAKAANFPQVKYAPLKIHEDIVVFSKNRHLYNAQMTTGIERQKGGYKVKGEFAVMDGAPAKINNTYYPKSILDFSLSDNKNAGLHPTQKHLGLMQYLIQTYSNVNDMVLDNTMGSGTTCLAAKELNRKFIGIEKEANYYEIACRRCGF